MSKEQNAQNIDDRELEKVAGGVNGANGAGDDFKSQGGGTNRILLSGDGNDLIGRPRAAGRHVNGEPHS